MAENQNSNPQNEAVAGNSAPVDSKATKNGEKRRQVAERKRSKNVYVCEVRLLDGTELAIEIEVRLILLFILKFMVNSMM